MKNNMRNKVQLIGFLAKDPETKKLESGKTLTKIVIGISETTQGQNGEKTTQTQWHNLVLWGNLADIAGKYLNKGNEVAVEGKLINRSYENSAGQKVYVTEIQVNELLMLGSKKAQAKAA